MARKYTAKEMREAADNLDSVYVAPECEDKKEQYGYLSKASMMLRQAADNMERKKKYEYSVKSIYGEVCGLHDDDKPRIPCLDNRFTRNCIIVRREVGEWEVVSNDNN